MSELGTPDLQPHPLEKARDFLARTAFVVALAVLLAAAYSGMQRRAVLQELKELDQALAFWAESAKRASALQEPLRRPAWRSGRERYIEARAEALLSSLCVDDALEERLLADLSAHYTERARQANAAASAAGVRGVTLQGVQRSAAASAPLFYELGAANPWRGPPSTWCAKGFHPLLQPLALLAAQEFAEALGDAADPLLGPEHEARLRALLDTPSSPLIRLLAERFSAAYLSELLSGWGYWTAELSWLLDELSREAVLVPDKDHRGYRSAGQVLDPITGLTELPNAGDPADLPIALAPIEAAARGAPTRYILEAGKRRAREANSREAFLAIVDDERKLLAKRRGPVEDRSEPEANAASWGGFQLPLAVFVTIAVLPALGLYLLYALYAAQVQALLAGQRRAEGALRDFWFPRLGSPKDPLARPWPRSVQQLLPRLFWLLFHAAPLALAFSASVLGLDPMGLADPARLSQPTDGLRILFAVLLGLSFHTAVAATSGGDDGQPGATLPASRRTGWPSWRHAVARLLRWLAVAVVVALPALVILGLWLMLGFQSQAWIFDCAVLAALTAIMLLREGRPSNFACLAYALLVAGTCLPYLNFALQVFAELSS